MNRKYAQVPSCTARISTLVSPLPSKLPPSLVISENGLTLRQARSEVSPSRIGASAAADAMNLQLIDGQPVRRHDDRSAGDRDGCRDDKGIGLQCRISRFRAWPRSLGAAPDRPRARISRRRVSRLRAGAAVTGLRQAARRNFGLRPGAPTARPAASAIRPHRAAAAAPAAAQGRKMRSNCDSPPIL